MAFKLDMAKFRKVSGDKNVTVMRHEDGHEMKIAHSALSPKLRAQLLELPSKESAEQPDQQPQKMAEGGLANPDPDKAKQFVKGATSSGWTPDKWIQNVKEGLSATPEPTPKPKPQTFAEGGDVAQPQAATTQPTIIINNGQQPQSQQPTEVDPGVAATRNIYNNLASVPERIGPDGNAAKLNPALWSRAEELYGQHQVSQQQSEQQQAAGIQAENVARQRAGLPPSSNAMPQMQPAQQPTEAPQTPPPSNMPAQAPQQQQQQSGPMDTYFQAATHGITEQKQAADMMAQAQAQKGASEAQASGAGAGMGQQALAENQQRVQANFQQYQHFMDDYANQHIDPEHYLNSQGTLGKIATGIGLILGGAGGGLGHQGNSALQFLNQQIDRDIQSQKDNIGIKKGLLEANMMHYGNIADATRMTQVMQRGIVADMLNKAGAEATGPTAKAAAMQAKGLLDQQNAFTLSQMGNPGTGASGGGNDMDHYLNMMRIVAPDKAKELSERYIPGVGIASIPLSETVRSTILERKLLGDNINQLLAFSQKYGGSLEGIADPRIKATGEALAKQVQDQYRRANSQGVFKPAEAQFVNGVLADKPSSIFAKFTKQPAYKAAAQINQGNLNALYQNMGIKAPQQATGQSQSSGYVPKSFKPAQ